MDDLVTWLSGCLDEDERVARAGGESCIAWLTYRNSAGQMLFTTVASRVADGPWVANGVVVSEPADTLVVYESAQVLTEVEAKRVILGRHTPRWVAGFDSDGEEHGDEVCETCDDDWPCPDALALALPYRDRPGYRPEWAPEQ